MQRLLPVGPLSLKTMPGPFLESGGSAQESTDLQKVLATPHREGQLAKNGMDPFCKLDGMVPFRDRVDEDTQMSLTAT